jgi:predicted RNA-binding Zn-ribbon protein involved in translation (DUF1610 family)
MFGLNIWHFRMLMENPFEGGGGYTPKQVAEMTPDQMYCRLSSLKVLEAKQKNKDREVRDDRTARGPTLTEVLERGSSKGGSYAAELREREKTKPKKGFRRRRKRAPKIAAEYWWKCDDGSTKINCPKCGQHGWLRGQMEKNLGTFVCPSMDCEFAGEVALEGWGKNGT